MNIYNGLTKEEMTAKIKADAAKGYGHAGIPGMTIDTFREQSRKETIERFEEKKRLQAEQMERVRLEAEAKKVPLQEEMREKVERLESRLSDLLDGDPRAVAVIRQSILDTLDIVAYVLDQRKESEQNEV